MPGQNKAHITLEVDDKGSAEIKKADQNMNQAFDRIKAGAKASSSRMAHSWKSAGNAVTTTFNKLKKSVFNLKTAFAALGAAVIVHKIKGAIEEYVGLAEVQESAEKRLESVVRATGMAAGYTSDELKGMAGAMQDLTTAGDETIMQGMAILATFKNIRGEAFERTTMAALDMSEVMQQDLKSSMVMIAKAMNDPVSNLSAMTRAGVQFTDQQEEMIKELWKAGDVYGAQAIILKELESQFGGAATAARETFGGSAKAAENALGDLKEELGYVITKNSFFIELMHLAEKQFVEWGNKIKENRDSLMDLAKKGVMGVTQAIIYVLKTMKFFHNAWSGIQLVGQLALEGISSNLEILIKGLRILLKPLDLVFEGLKKIGKIEINPFDAVQGAFEDFHATTTDVRKEIVQDIKDTNSKYNNVIQTLESWKLRLGEIQVKQTDIAEKTVPQPGSSDISTPAAATVDLSMYDKEAEGIQKSFQAIQDAEAQYYQDRIEKQKEFSAVYAEMNRSAYDLERERIEEQARVWREAGADKIQVAQWTANEIARIEREVNMARLDFAESVSGGIAETFQTIAEAGGEQSRIAFRIYQAAAMAEAAISGAKAIMQVYGDPTIPSTVAKMTMAGVIAAKMAVQMAMIGSAAPPSYDQGGVSTQPGIYYAGVPEAHIPLKNGSVPVSIQGGAQQRQEITILNAVSPAMLDTYMATPAGKNAVLNVIANNSRAVRRVLR